MPIKIKPATGAGSVSLEAQNAISSDFTLTLPGVTGTVNTSGAVNQVPAGSVSAPSIFPTGDTNTGIYFPAADTIGFVEGGVESMRLDSSGNVGIGTTSPGTRLEVTASGVNGINLATAGSLDSPRLFFTGSGGAGTSCVINNANGALRFGYSATVGSSSGTEAMRIDSSGNLLVNTTSTLGTGKLQVRGGIIGDNSSTDGNLNIECRGGTIFSNSIYNSTTSAGASVSITGSAGFLQRSTSSIKYKTQVENLEPQLSEAIYSMRPVWYRSLCEMDRKDWSWYGLIAEEVAEIEPRLVHYGMPDDDGVRHPEGVMYDRLTVFLLAEMQKLSAKLDAAEARIAALEAK